jgi:hypothetical protein
MEAVNIKKYEICYDSSLDELSVRYIKEYPIIPLSKDKDNNSKSAYNTVKRLKDSVKTDWSLEQNDKLYILPGCTVPRAKIKDLLKANNAKVVRDPLEATKIIFGTETIRKITNQSWARLYSKKAILAMIKVFKEGGSSVKCINCSETSIEEIDYPYIECNYLNFLKNYNKVSELFDKVLKENSETVRLNIHSAYITNDIYQIKNEHLNKFEYLDFTKYSLYDEKSIIKDLNNDDSVVIDETVYETLTTMLESGDVDNVVLGMEIMANSLYQESLPYLIILMKRYGYRIYDRKERNHVNFKSLLKYLDVSTHTHMNMGKAFSILKNNSGLTKENVEIIFKDFQHEFVSYYGSTYVRQYCLDPEIQEELGKNLIYNTLTEEYIWTEPDKKN